MDERDGTDAGSGTRHIGAVAELTGLSLRTLRHYDEVGLVPPSGRSDGGFRLYVEDDVQRLLLIRRMKPLGFTLDEMRDLLDLVDAIDADGDTAIHARLEAYVGAAEERRAELARKLDMADELIALLRARAGVEGDDTSSPSTVGFLVRSSTGSPSRDHSERSSATVQ